MAPDRSTKIMAQKVLYLTQLTPHRASPTPTQPQQHACPHRGCEDLRDPSSLAGQRAASDESDWRDALVHKGQEGVASAVAAAARVSSPESEPEKRALFLSVERAARRPLRARGCASEMLLRGVLVAAATLLPSALSVRGAVRFGTKFRAIFRRSGCSSGHNSSAERQQLRPRAG